MTRLLLVLWASLVAVELSRGMIAMAVPGKDRTGVEGDRVEVEEGVLACAVYPLPCVLVHSTKPELLPMLQGSLAHPVPACRVPGQRKSLREQ